MLELLIAILIALGCDVRSGSSEEQLKNENPAAYNQAQQIMADGNYRQQEGEEW
jgi:hypothetical protein